jgi:hypothetical protein
MHSYIQETVRGATATDSFNGRCEDVQSWLVCFLNLESVTVMREAHQLKRCGLPLYSTPFIKSLPPGFRYPRPSAWQWQWDYSGRHDPHDLDNAYILLLETQHPNIWTTYSHHGFLVAIEQLAINRLGHIQAFRIDVNDEAAGIPHNLFCQPLHNTTILRTFVEDYVNSISPFRFVDLICKELTGNFLKLVFSQLHFRKPRIWSISVCTQVLERR